MVNAVGCKLITRGFDSHPLLHMPEKFIWYGRLTHIQEAVGSNPTFGTILGSSQVGKAPDFDSGIP